jgi:hypothetical protein
VLRSVDSAYAAANRKLSTPRLTTGDQSTRSSGKIRTGRGADAARIAGFAHQGGRNPPDGGGSVATRWRTSLETYRRYLEGAVRAKFDLEGTPMRIGFRTGANPFAEVIGASNMRCARSAWQPVATDSDTLKGLRPPTGPIHSAMSADSARGEFLKRSLSRK